MDFLLLRQRARLLGRASLAFRGPKGRLCLCTRAPVKQRNQQSKQRAPACGASWTGSVRSEGSSAPARTNLRKKKQVRWSSRSPNASKNAFAAARVALRHAPNRRRNGTAAIEHKRITGQPLRELTSCSLLTGRTATAYRKERPRFSVTIKNTRLSLRKTRHA